MDSPDDAQLDDQLRHLLEALYGDREEASVRLAQIDALELFDASTPPDQAAAAQPLRLWDNVTAETVVASGSGWERFGRVAPDGTVYVRTAQGERLVGSWQTGTPAEALAYFARRFADLVTEVDLVEARLKSSTADASHSLASVERLRHQLDEAPVVGDIDGLAARLEALAGIAGEARAVRGEAAVLTSAQAEETRASDAAREREFTLFYTDQMARLTGFLMVQGARSTVAADVAQEAMTEAYRHWDSIDRPGAWVRTVASRIWWRRSQRDRAEDLGEVFDEQAMTIADPELGEIENRHALLAVLRSLPPSQREVLAWTYDGFQPTEIASLLGVAPAAVRARLRAARARLRKGASDGTGHDDAGHGG